MIKVLHLQTEINIACGVSKMIYLIMKHLEKEIQQDLICLGGDGLARFNSLNRKPLVYNYNRNTITGSINIAKKIIDYCKKNEINIIHSHHRYFDFLIFLVRRFLKKKTIMTVHSKVSGYKYFSYKSDRIIACSNFIKIHLQNTFKMNPEKIFVINNFIDTQEIGNYNSSDNKKSADIPGNSIILGYIGRIDFEEKGLDILLRGFADLSKSDPRLYLMIVGNGIDKEKTKNFIIENKLNAKLIDGDIDVYRYYSMADIIVVPSRTEPFGLVILESAAMKKPVIAGKVDGILELVKDKENCLLFEKDDLSGLKNCILKLINDKSYSDKLASNLHKDLFNKYSAETLIPEYLKLYETIS